MKNLNLKEMKFEEYNLEEMNLNIKYVENGYCRNSIKIQQGKIQTITKKETLLFQIEYLVEIITEEGKMYRCFGDNREVDFKYFIIEEVEIDIYRKDKNKLRCGDFCIYEDADIEIEKKLRKEAYEIKKEEERKKDRSLALGNYCHEDIEIEVITMPESPKVGDIIQIKIEEKLIKRGGNPSFLFYPPNLTIPYNDFFKKSMIDKKYGELVFELKDKYIYFIYVDDVKKDDGSTIITFMVCSNVYYGTHDNFERMKKCYKDGTYSKVSNKYYLRSCYLSSPDYKGQNISIEKYFIK